MLWKSVVSLVLLVSLLAVSSFPSLGAEGYFEGYLSGQQAAQASTNGTGWLIGGFAGGFLFGLLGGATAVVAATANDPAPDFALQTNLNGKSDDFRRGYFEGYAKEARQKNVNNSLIGAAAGVMCAVLVIASEEDDTYYAARPLASVKF